MSVLEEIISRNDIRQQRLVEGCQLGSVVASTIRICKYDLYLYGGGMNAWPLVNYLHYLDVKVTAIFDKDEGKRGNIIDNIKVFDISDMQYVIENPNKAFIVVSISDLSPTDYMSITRLMCELSINKFYFLDKCDFFYIYGGTTNNRNNRMIYYKEHVIDLENIYNELIDKESKDTMMEYIRSFVQVGSYFRRSCDGRVKYFYGTNKENKFEVLYNHLPDEVWLNCGSNIGDSIFLFFNAFLNARRIYAFEGDKVNFRRLNENIKFLPEDKKELIITVNKYINQNTDFIKYINESITFINADIEGNELYMLNALKEIMINDRPVISVCIYHKTEDLVEIPLFLMNILKDYSYRLRKYEGITDYPNAQELVLFAIPNERMSNDQWVELFR